MYRKPTHNQKGIHIYISIYIYICSFKYKTDVCIYINVCTYLYLYIIYVYPCNIQETFGATLSETLTLLSLMKVQKPQAQPHCTALTTSMTPRFQPLLHVLDEHLCTTGKVESRWEKKIWVEKKKLLWNLAPMHQPKKNVLNHTTGSDVHDFWCSMLKIIPFAPCNHSGQIIGFAFSWWGSFQWRTGGSWAWRLNLY